MNRTREELREELMAVLAAGRELDPSHDGYLANVFLDQLDNRRSCRTRPDRRIRRLLGAILVAGSALAIGVPLESRLTQPTAACSVFLPKAYPSYKAVMADVPAMKARGYHRDGAGQFFAGRLHVYWQRNWC